MGIQVLLYIELGKPQTCSFFLPWKLCQKLGQLATAFRKVCRRALLVQSLPVSLLCCKIFRTMFTRLHRSGGRVCVSAPVSEGLDLSRPRGICPECVVELGFSMQGSN